MVMTRPAATLTGAAGCARAGGARSSKQAANNLRNPAIDLPLVKTTVVLSLSKHVAQQRAIF